MLFDMLKVPRQLNRGASIDQIANETHVVAPAVLQRVDWPVPTGVPCQQPQKQDEAYAAHTHPSKNELSDSGVT